MDLRSDIVAAAARMNTDHDVHREVRQLGAYLHDGETVQRLAAGIYGAGAGLMAVTDHRVLLLRDGRSGHASEGFPLGRLSSADWVAEGGRAAITVSDSSSTAVLRQVTPADAQQVVELIHELAGQQRGYGGSGYQEATAYQAAPSYNPPVSAVSSYSEPSFAAERTTALHTADATTALHTNGTNGYGSHSAAATATETGRGIGGQSSYSGEATTALRATGTGLHSTPASHGSHGIGSYGTNGAESYGTPSYGTNGNPSYGSESYGTNGANGTGLYDTNGTNGTGAHSTDSPSGGLNGLDLTAPTTALRSPLSSPETRPEWSGSHSAPTTGTGYYGTEGSGSGRSASGAVPISVIASTTGIPAQPTVGRVPEQSTASEQSGPIGTQPKLIGEVPITTLAAEEPTPSDVVPTSVFPAQASVGIDQLAAESQPGQLGPETATLAVSSTAITEAPTSIRRDDKADTPAESDEKPAIDPANLTAEGNERPKPISWRAPAGKKTSPQRETETRSSRKKRGPVRLEALGKPSPAGSGPGDQPRTLSKKYMWLGAGAVALVALAAIGSAKLITGNQQIQAAAPVSPAPAAAIDSPVGTVVKITKVIAPDRVEVSEPAGSEVVVLGIAVPNSNGCGYAISKAFANRTLSNQMVTMVQDPSQPVTDKQGRRQAYLRTADGTDYSTEAVTQGMAKYYDGSRPVEKADELKTAQDAAKEKKSGLWDTPCNGKFADSSSSSTANATAASTKESTKPKSSSTTSTTTKSSSRSSTTGTGTGN
ncbi:thermonuclease family protein [Pseudonocardia spinosispora]|uniref:thermonuclease family protein n=1 Tax=Pseudonocardia spinosispora TaxID=103441 RepID=UPI00041E19FC|nr:thermonuclease family protein [Pseudonocardia spinosispora]